MESLTAYVDDSFSRDERVFCLAGYIAPDQVWLELFAPAWRRLLQRAPRRIREFKTSDCRAGRQGFRGWTEAERTGLIDRACDVIVSSVPESDMVGFAYCVSTPRGKKPDPKWVKTWQRATFEFALHSVMLGLIKYSGWMERGMSLSLVIDKKKGFAKYLVPAWRRVRSAFESETAGLVLKAPREALSHEELPVQAADLLANLTSREALARLEEMDVGVDQALERIVRGRFHAARCHNYDDLADAVAGYRESGVLPWSDDLDRLYRTGEPIRSPALWPWSRPGIAEIARRVAMSTEGAAGSESGRIETS